MGFTFNKNDIQASSQKIDFGGDYNVIIKQAEYKGLTRSNSEYFTMQFEVLDGEEIGKHVTHVFIDDTDSEKAFRYREINAMINAIGGVQDGVSFELKDVSKTFVGQQLAIRVREFEKSQYKGKMVYNPQVAEFSALMPNGSKPDKNNPRPDLNGGNEEIKLQEDSAFPTDKDLPTFPSNDPFGG